jgi:hypothetical protein
MDETPLTQVSKNMNVKKCTKRWVSFFALFVITAQVGLMRGQAVAAESSGERFQTDKDGTALDLHLHLRWMRCVVGQIWQSGRCMGEPQSFRWDEVELFLEGFAFAGRQEWKLPSLGQLSSIIVCESGQRAEVDEWGRGGECVPLNPTHALDAIVFPDPPRSIYPLYWTADTPSSLGNSAWSVDLETGRIYDYRKNRRKFYLRLVHSEP